VFQHLVEVGAINYSPAGDVRGVKRPKSHIHKRSALTSTEFRAVLETCDKTTAGIRDHALIMLMVYCGLRTIEVHRANVEDLGTEGERKVLYVTGKGRMEADESAVIPRSQEPVIRARLIERRPLMGKPHLSVCQTELKKNVYQPEQFEILLLIIMNKLGLLVTQKQLTA